MAAMILTALAVGVGVTSTTNPTAQVAMVLIGGLLVWAIVRVLGRAGEIWRFTAPYSEPPRMERSEPPGG